MTLRETILNSLALLSARNRRILALVIGVLTASGLLDLLGIVLLGLVAALSVSVLTDTTTPVVVQQIAERFGLGSTDIPSLAVLLAAVAGLALISKTAITLYLNRRTLRFLNRLRRLLWHQASLAPDGKTPRCHAEICRSDHLQRNCCL